MKKLSITLTLLLLSLGAYAQTMLIMNTPEQAKEPLKIRVLFDEEVPEGMPVVLGLMGYKVTGGIEPYRYEWIQNGEIIGTGDIVVITPSKGDQFELKAWDKNKCYSVNSFSMRVLPRMDTDEQEKADACKIWPSLITDTHINITLPDREQALAAILRVYDMSGQIKQQNSLSGSARLQIKLPSGTYFVSVLTDEFHKVEKVIVKQ